MPHTLCTVHVNLLYCLDWPFPYTVETLGGNCNWDIFPNLTILAVLTIQYTLDLIFSVNILREKGEPLKNVLYIIPLCPFLWHYIEDICWHFLIKQNSKIFKW